MKKILISIFSFLPAFLFSQQFHYETKILSNVVDGKISKYETVEIGIRIPEQQRQFRAFLQNHSTGINPYAQTSLRLQFICHGKIYYANAFYFEDATADEKQNKYVTHESDWPWRIRFAVPDTGHWNCNLLVGNPIARAIPKFCAISFDCIPGNNHGYINVSPDHKHFQYSDGTPFFPIAQNIAFVDAPILHGQTTWPTSGYCDIYHYMNDFADDGGNYVRIGMVPWSTGGIVNETYVYAQDRACALDSMMRIAQARGLHIHLCVDLTTGQSYDAAKENPDPIHRDFLKAGMTCADLLHDSSALAAFDQYLRYVYARWAFSPTVATIEILSEQNSWDGFNQHENYFNDFITHVNDLLRNELGDHDHMLSTSCTNTGHVEIFQNSALSFIDEHMYDNNFNCNKKRFEIVNSRAVKKMDKPFFFGEMGMINGPVNAADAGDYEACNDISMHNAIWSSLFFGTAGIGEYWWNWGNDDFRKNNYPALKFFIDSIQQNIVFTKNKMWNGNGLETFYEVNAADNLIVGWVHNESSWWGNMDTDCKERNNKKMMLPKDDDKATTIENRAGNIFVVKGLEAKKIYRIVFYDSRIPGKEIETQKAKSNRFGKLKLKFPANCVDCAFKIIPAGTNCL